MRPTGRSSAVMALVIHSVDLTNINIPASAVSSLLAESVTAQQIHPFSSYTTAYPPPELCLVVNVISEVIDP